MRAVLRHKLPVCQGSEDPQLQILTPPLAEAILSRGLFSQAYDFPVSVNSSIPFILHSSKRYGSRETSCIRFLQFFTAREATKVRL